jgi:hypothetical protein
MGRKPGSKNKITIIREKGTWWKRLLKGRVILTNEEKFIEELSRGYVRWQKIGEKEYSAAYRILLNRFTEPIDEPTTE